MIEHLSPVRSQRSSASAELIARGPAFEYFSGDDEEKARGLFAIVDENGQADERDVTGITQELATSMLHGMLRIRVVDRRMLALQRQGRISFYGEARGQEAAVVGSAAAMERGDWLVPALREAGAGLYRGLSLDNYIAQIYGNVNDVTKGRQMPCHPCDRDNNYVVMSSVVSTQIPHAVGIAMGMKITGDNKVCVGFMGDGGLSEGDFHVAINFAGVTRAPVVLICQNNQWAISTPGEQQTAAETIALKGIGYGVESLRVDGNDVVAVYEATKYATDKARRGEGPTFIELLTYRVSAHSTSDDPSRYRDESVTDEWRDKRDPILRLEKLMIERNWLANDGRATIEAQIETHIRSVVATQDAAATPSKETLIEDVFERPWWRLSEDFATLVDE